MTMNKRLIIGFLITVCMVFGAHTLYAQRVTVKNEPQDLRAGDDSVSEQVLQGRDDVYRYDPFADLLRMHGLMRRMMDGWDLDAGMPAAGQDFFSPDIDVHESKEAYTIRCDMPGLEKDKIDISLNKNILTISGERREVKEEEKDADGSYYHVSERRFGSFQRSFSLPEDIQDDQIRAEYDSGVLTITIPRVEDQDQDAVRKIQIL